MINFRRVDFRLLFVFIKKLFFCSFVRKNTGVTHETEISAINFQHFIKHLSLRFGPLTTFDHRIGTFVNVFIGLWSGLFIFWNHFKNVLNCNTFLKSIGKIFTMINWCAAKWGFDLKFVLQYFYHQQLIIFIYWFIKIYIFIVLIFHLLRINFPYY